MIHWSDYSHSTSLFKQNTLVNLLHIDQREVVVTTLLDALPLFITLLEARNAVLKDYALNLLLIMADNGVYTC